jgi:hypothetical protein
MAKRLIVLFIIFISLLMSSNPCHSQSMYLEKEKFAVGFGASYNIGSIFSNSMYSNNKGFNGYSGLVGISILKIFDVGVSHSRAFFVNSTKNNSITTAFIDLFIKNKSISIVINTAHVNNDGKSNILFGGTVYTNIKQKSKLLSNIIPFISLGTLLHGNLVFSLGVSFAKELSHNTIIALKPSYGESKEQEQFTIGLEIIFK